LAFALACASPLCYNAAMASSLLEEYHALLERVVERKAEVDRFKAFLESETSWLTSPASTRFHLNEEQGLLKHSVGVCKTLLHMKQFMRPEISDESATIVGLFHDVGKVGYAGNPLYLPNPKPEEVRRGITYITSPKVTKMGLAVRSLYLIAKYVTLTEEEAQAITYHDGQYIEENKVVAHYEKPLTLLVHFADMWTASMLE
jgi:hypothetical protein